MREPPPGTPLIPAIPPEAGPLRLLLAHADPGSPEYPRLAHLAAEVGAVRAALNEAECRRVEIQELPDATPGALQRALRKWKPHILHLIGHGNVQATGGVLVLQGEREGQAAPVYADEMAEWLTESSVRLAVLSACRTGSGIGGTARSLSAAGVPAVVAMQLPLRDAAAGLFSRAFYAALLASCTVEEALSQARQALRGMGSDWGVPVLYQSSPSAPLFAPSPPSPPPLPPTNLPYRPSEAFVGRDGMMDKLQSVLRREGRSAALIGMSGLGKTQLAAEYGHARRADYPGGVFWVGARTTSQLTDDLAALGRRFFGAPSDLSTEEACGRARDALMGKPGPTLLVADNVTAETKLSLLPPTGACRLLLTMQEGALTPPGIGRFHLPVLDEDTAQILLGAADAEESERREASAIAALLGNLPLALSLAAGHIARLGLSFAEYHARLADARFETLGKARRYFTNTTGHPGAVYDALSLAHQGLTATAQAALTAASVLGPYPITPDLLFETWAGGPPSDFEDFEEALGDLADRTLVTRGSDKRLSVHELMRAFAREQITPADRAGAVVQAAAALSRRLSTALETGAPAALNAARHEAAHADTVAGQCRDLGLDNALAPLLLAMGQMACQAGRYAQARIHFDEGLRLLRAQGPDSPAVIPFLYERSAVEIDLKEYVSALTDARAALTLARRIFGRNGPVLTEYYTQVGLSLRHLGRFAQARRFYDRALALAEAAQGRRHRMTAVCLNNLGALLKVQGNLHSALTYQSEAVQIFQDVLGPEAAEIGIPLNNLGDLLGSLGRWEEALARHQEALTLYLTAYEGSYDGRHPDVARSLFYIAEAHRALGRKPEALAGYQESFSLYEYFYGPDDERTNIVRERIATL